MNVFTGITDRVHYHIMGNGTHVGGQPRVRDITKISLGLWIHGICSFSVGCGHEKIIFHRNSNTFLINDLKV